MSRSHPVCPDHRPDGAGGGLYPGSPDTDRRVSRHRTDCLSQYAGQSLLLLLLLLILLLLFFFVPSTLALLFR